MEIQRKNNIYAENGRERETDFDNFIVYNTNF